MTRRRWIADEFSDNHAALTGEHASHLSRTLRVRVGQEFDVACGNILRRATVSSVSADRVEFALGEELLATAVAPVTLLLAVFKFDRMEWAIEKCTELNVTTIVPLIARRTEKHLALAAEKRVERWRRIAREAAEQSRRISPPEITEPMKLKDALEACAKPEDDVPSRPRSEATSGGTCCSPQSGLKIVLAETERAITLSDILHAHPNPQSVALAVGPEGGWTPDELELVTRSQWIPASLGETVLRAETAAIAALAVAIELQAHGTRA
jgi:16S rRNA (uracil1498-N3)-methyltransferase